MAREKKSSGFAVFIILAGIAIILYNLNILKWDMFWGVVHLWPLLLVVGGLSILFRNVRHFEVVLWLVFFGIVIAYSFLNMDQKSWFIGEPVNTVDYEVTFDNVADSKLNLNIATGRIKLNDGQEGKMTYILPDIGIKTNNTSQENEYMDILIEDNSRRNVLTSLQNRYYEFNLPKESQWTIDIDAAALSGDFDISQMSVEKFKLDYAVGDLSVKTGQVGDIDIDFAVGNLEVDIPEDGNVRIKIDGAINALDVPSSFTKDGSFYYSKDFDQDQPFLDLFIDLAVGNVEIK